MIHVKRVYEPRGASDGKRILVDRLWPRGLTKRKAAIDAWMRDVAPSTELRQWFSHEPAWWAELKRRYTRELQAHRDLLREVTTLATRRRVTLVYGARDETHNEATVLAAIIRSRIRTAHKRRAAARAR
jgi:uncharacterized protein YeaO (DUF488 family)